MEVPDVRFDAWKVIHVVDALGGIWCALQNEVESFHDVFGGGDLKEFIEGLPSVLVVKDDSICVIISNIFN